MSAFEQIHEPPAVWPSVTVVIPSRGRPAQLERALRTILAQRYEGELQSIVVLDGPDAEAADANLSLTLLARLNGRRNAVRILRNSRTPGPSGARNTGALAADSDFVAFCDDDDEWLPDKLQEQVGAVLRGDASAATCGIDVAFRGRTITRCPESEAVTFEELLRSRRTDMHTSTMLVRREAFIGSIGTFDEAIPGSYGEDYDWLLRAARVGPILTPRRVLATIHWHESSFFEGRWQMIIDALSYLLAKHPEFGRDPKGLARIYGQLAFASAALGRSGDARYWARGALVLDVRQPRAYLALLVAAKVLGAGALLRFLHRFGRSI